jgi:hypothetical protein
MIFKIFLPKNLAKTLAFLCSNCCYFFAKNDHSIGIFAEKLAKIAEIYDHNIDPILTHRPQFIRLLLPLSRSNPPSNHVAAFSVDFTASRKNKKITHNRPCFYF